MLTKYVMFISSGHAPANISFQRFHLDLEGLDPSTSNCYLVSQQCFCNASNELHFRTNYRATVRRTPINRLSATLSATLKGLTEARKTRIVQHCATVPAWASPPRPKSLATVLPRAPEKTWALPCTNFQCLSAPRRSGGAGCQWPIGHRTSTNVLANEETHCC